MYSAPCLTGVFSICFFLFVTIWVTSLGSILRSCELRRNFSFTPCFRGPQMVRYASAFRLLPAQVHSSGTTERLETLFWLRMAHLGQTSYRSNKRRGRRA